VVVVKGSSRVAGLEGNKRNQGGSMNARSKICREICPHLTRKQRVECRIKGTCEAYCDEYVIDLERQLAEARALAESRALQISKMADEINDLKSLVKKYRNKSK